MTGTAVAPLLIDVSKLSSPGPRNVRRTVLRQITAGSDADTVEITMSRDQRPALDDEHGVMHWIREGFLQPRSTDNPVAVTQRGNLVIFTINVKPGSLRLPDDGHHLLHPRETPITSAPTL